MYTLYIHCKVDGEITESVERHLSEKENLRYVSEYGAVMYRRGYLIKDEKGRIINLRDGIWLILNG